MPYRCLIVERDGGVAQAISRECPAFGFRSYLAAGADAALGILRQWCFDAIVVDGEGFGPPLLQLLRRLQSSSRSPLVLLSRSRDEREQLLGLESGATEIVTTPASTRLITAKLRRLIEVATREPEGAPLRLGPLTLHPDRALARVGETSIRLTAHEFELLALLAERAGRLVDRETIAAALRGQAGEVGRGADVHVYRIRRKLKAHGIDSLRLDTIYGRGYCLSLQDDDAEPA